MNSLTQNQKNNVLLTRHVVNVDGFIRKYKEINL